LCIQLVTKNTYNFYRDYALFLKNFEKEDHVGIEADIKNIVWETYIKVNYNFFLSRYQDFSTVYEDIIVEKQKHRKQSEQSKLFYSKRKYVLLRINKNNLIKENFKINYISIKDYFNTY
jgi:hypothetical protein